MSVDTVRRWRSRDTQHDASHTPHRLPTVLTPAQEAVVVELRRTLELSLDNRKHGGKSFILLIAANRPQSRFAAIPERAGSDIDMAAAKLQASSRRDRIRGHRSDSLSASDRSTHDFRTSNATA